MNLGIKRKMLLVLVGVLALTTSLDALLASYYTKRQNQEGAFAALESDLLAWSDELRDLTLHLKGAALSIVGDAVVLNQLTELVSLELSAGAAGGAQAARDAMARQRGLSYVKAISLNRLHLALRTSGLSSIAVFTDGKLNFFISRTEAGMTIRRGDAVPVWVRAPVDADGHLDFQSWPAWREGRLPALAPGRAAEAIQPGVSFTFPSAQFAAIEITVPVQGVFEGHLSDFVQPVFRLVSALTIAEPTLEQGEIAVDRQRRTAAVLVFSKVIDRAALDGIASKTGKWPVLFSPDGRHQQRVTGANLIPESLLREAQTVGAGQPARVIHQTVTTEHGSYYEALLPWQFDKQTRLILGLTSSRASTLQNVRQTVTAILIASGLILVLSIGVGIYWVGRFIDPIVALTEAVKQIGKQRRLGGEQAEGSTQFQFLAIEAPDEIGELSSAFNVMTLELRHAFETLELRVQTRTAELRQQTRYLRTLIDTLPLWVWLKDTERRYLATNQANADACGYTVDEMLGKSDQELWPPELAERYCADDVEVMSMRQRKTVEEAIAGANGTVWMETYRAPVLDEDGTLLGTVGAARNISERKAAEAAREAALAEAVRLARQRSDFLAQMSHELRTPLNAIMGYAQLLRRDTHQLTERQVSGLGIIQESGQHLLTLINDILDLARVEAGKLALNPVPVNLASFLRVVADIIQVKAEEKSLMFTYQASPELPTSLMADDKRLRQVLLNLLGNAVKFTDRGEIVLRVQYVASSLLAGQAVARLRFEVADSGIGMSEAQLSRIFQPFEQVADMQRREGGTGLGLAISQQLIHLMGGTIHVESQPDKGSRFWFELDLPIAEPDLEALPAPRVVVGYTGPRRSALIVDDVPQNRAMLMDLLQSVGFAVRDARNGQECLDLLDSVKPDLILMDGMMPVMGGHEAVRRIRTMPKYAGLPIILVTASASHDEQLRSYEAGASSFLAKPIEQDLLLKTIGELLSLTWIEEAIPEQAAGMSEETVRDLVIPPLDEMETLSQLAKLGDMQQIWERAAYLIDLDIRYAPFADRLRKLAQGYQSKAIAVLVERYHKELKGRAVEQSST